MQGQATGLRVEDPVLRDVPEALLWYAALNQYGEDLAGAVARVKAKRGLQPFHREVMADVLHGGRRLRWLLDMAACAPGQQVCDQVAVVQSLLDYMAGQLFPRWHFATSKDKSGCLVAKMKLCGGGCG